MAPMAPPPDPPLHRPMSAVLKFFFYIAIKTPLLMVVLEFFYHTFQGKPL
jgi:hypothetical protein